MERKIDRFLRLMNDRGASDFHLAVGRPPMLRVSGDMEQVRYRTMQEADWVDMVQAIAPPERWQEFIKGGDTDFAYDERVFDWLLAYYRANNQFRNERVELIFLRMNVMPIATASSKFRLYLKTQTLFDWRYTFSSSNEITIVWATRILLAFPSLHISLRIVLGSYS